MEQCEHGRPTNECPECAQPIASRGATEPGTEQETIALRERERVQGIIRACEAARLPLSTAKKMIDEGTSLLEAQTQVLEQLRGRSADDSGPRPGASGVRITNDPLQTTWNGIEGALLHRIAPKTFPLDDNARQYRTHSLVRTMEECLEQRGVRTRGLSRSQIVTRALHTTSDFANILDNVTNKTLRNAYEAAPQTWQPISRRIEAPDFKAINRVQLAEAPPLEKVLEHGEFTSGTIAEGKESFRLATYGKWFGLTRQALINDDLDAFGRLVTMFGQSARNLESDVVWSQILANAAMGDLNNLFSTAHGNLAGVGAAISTTSLGSGRAAMRKQTGLDGVTYLNIMARYLIVPPEKETLADQYVSVNLVASQASSVNPFSGRLTVVAEPRLNGITLDGTVIAGSAVSWYLAASTDQPIDMIEYAYLSGSDGPEVITRTGFEVDGIQVRCRHDFAAKVIDWRGLYKDPGA